MRKEIASASSEVKQNPDIANESPHKSSPEVLQVRLSWQGTTVDIGHFEKPRKLTIGAHPLNDFRLGMELVEEVNYPLIVPVAGTGFGVFFIEQFGGEVCSPTGLVTPLSEASQGLPRVIHQGLAGHVYPLESGETLTLEHRELQVEIKLVESVRKSQYKSHWDYLFWRMLSFSGIAHLAMILMFQFVPAGQLSMRGDFGNKRFTQLIVAPAPVPRRVKKPIQLRKRPKPRQVVKTPTHSDQKSETQTQKRPQARVRDKGVLGLLTRTMGSAGSGSVFGKVNMSWMAGKPLGVSGSGSVGGYGIGDGRCFGSNCTGGDGNGGGYGPGGGKWGNLKAGKYARKRLSMRGGTKKKGRVLLIAPKLTISNGLSKDQIARVVQRNWYGIKYCYERGLRRNTKLSGKVKIRWIIAGSGRVQSAAVEQSTMNDERVENCLIRRVLRWRFPQPQGGGIVVVNYPFLFFRK